MSGKPTFTLPGTVLSLARMEWRIGRRTAVFRFMTALSFLFGCTLGGADGHGVGLSAYVTAEAGWQYLGFVAIIWMSLAAVRETMQRTSILVFSKPQTSERLALAKFLGAMLQLLVFLFALFAGSICARLFSGLGLLGVGAYLTEYIRVAGVLFFAASASYTLALLFDNVIAGALVGLYWVLTLAGHEFLAKYFFPAYTQNLLAYVVLGLAFLSVALLLYGRKRRGDTPPASWIRISVPVCLLLTGWLFWTILRDGHDIHARLNPILSQMEVQDLTGRHRVPGFQLPDQTGRLKELSDYPGKILVIALWSPQDPDSVLLLDRLNDIQLRLGGQGVQSVAICLSEDNGAGAAFAQGEKLQYPVVDDWGTGNGPDPAQISPLSRAYRPKALPMVVITDRRRCACAAMTGTEAYDGTKLDQYLQERLTDEPQ